MCEVLQDDLIDCSFCLVEFLRDEDLLLELGAHVEVALLLSLALLARSGSIEIECRQVLLHIIIARLQQSLLKSVNLFVYYNAIQTYKGEQPSKSSF